jgi:hypothetical protein
MWCAGSMFVRVYFLSLQSAVVLYYTELITIRPLAVIPNTFV